MAQSLINEILDHVLGKKYYCVLLSRPNLRVKNTDGKHPYEMSSDIFFTLEEAKEYYHKMHDSEKDAVFNTHGIISFRSHEDIPRFNMQLQDKYKKEYNDTMLY